jgi:sporulation protein YlmC with PRC-barrel domain
MTEFQRLDDVTSTMRVVVHPRRERLLVEPTGDPIVLGPSPQGVPPRTAVVRREQTVDPVPLSTLKDMAVISLADGAKIGHVKDMFFDTSRRRVVAFVVASDAGEALLSFDAVHSIGPDALTVETAGATQELRRLADLLELKAVDTDGTLLGEVKELEVDRHDGRLTELVVHQGGLLGLGGTEHGVPASAVRSIGPGLAMVELPAPEIV